MLRPHNSKANQIHASVQNYISFCDYTFLFLDLYSVAFLIYISWLCELEGEIFRRSLYAPLEKIPHAWKLSEPCNTKNKLLKIERPKIVFQGRHIYYITAQLQLHVKNLPLPLDNLICWLNKEKFGIFGQT